MDKTLNLIIALKQTGSQVVDQVKTGLGQINQKLTEFSSSARSVNAADAAVSSLGNTIRTVLGALSVYKIAGFVKDTALASSRFGEMGIVMNVVGKNAGYTAEQLAWLDNELRKTGISMTESRSSITKMAQGGIELSKAVKLARAAQDAAVIGQMNSSEALEAMVHGIQSAQIDVLRNIGINVNFEQSYAKVAKATGRATSSLSEHEKMMIRVNAVLEATTHIQGVYEASMTNAGKQLRTLTGRELPDFKVAMGKAFDPAFADIVHAVRNALKEMRAEITRPDVQKSLGDLSKIFAKMVTDIGSGLPDAIARISGSLQTLVNRYDKLPDGVGGAAGVGLIGALLFGRKAGLILAFITYTQERLDKLNAELNAASGKGQGVLTFPVPPQPPPKPPNMDPNTEKDKPKPLDPKIAEATLQSQLERMKAANQTILLQLQASYKEGKLSLEKYFADRLAIINQEYEKEAEVTRQMASVEGVTAEDKIKISAKLFALEQAHARDVINLKSEKAKELADLEDALSKRAIERNKATSETELAAIKIKYDSGLISIQEYIAARTEILNRGFEIDKQNLQKEIDAENETRKRMDLEDKLYELVEKHKKDELDLKQELIDGDKAMALERAQAIQGMYQAMGESSKQAFDAQITILNEQADRYRKLKIDQLVIDKWYANEVYNLQKQQALGSNDFYAGWRQAYKDLIKDQTKLGQQGFDAFNGILAESKTALSSFFDDAWSGKLKTAGDYFRSFAKNISKVFSDMVAEMISRWMMLQAMKGLSSIFGSFTGGGSSNPVIGNVQFDGGKMADGGKIPGSSPSPKADNIPIWATAGEFMHPVSAVQYYGTRVMEAIRRRMIPRDFFAQFSLPSFRHSPSFALADGGSVSSSPGGYSITVPQTFNGVDRASRMVKILPAEIEETVIRVMKREMR